MKNAARVGDRHECSAHRSGDNRIVSSPATMSCDGRQIATVGALTSCGAVIVEGSDTWLIGGKQVAVLGSKTLHTDSGATGVIASATARISFGRG